MKDRPGSSSPTRGPAKAAPAPGNRPPARRAQGEARQSAPRRRRPSRPPRPRLRSRLPRLHGATTARRRRPAAHVELAIKAAPSVRLDGPKKLGVGPGAHPRQRPRGAVCVLIEDVTKFVQAPSAAPGEGRTRRASPPITASRAPESSSRALRRKIAERMVPVEDDHPALLLRR